MALVDTDNFAWPMAVTDISGSTSDAAWTPFLGMIRWAYDNTYGSMCAYKCVKYRAAATAAGYTYTYAYQTASRKDYDVIQPLTATLNLFAGVAMYAAGAGYMGWLQIYGFSTTIYGLGSTGAVSGATGSLSANDGHSLKCVDQKHYLVRDKNVGTAPSYRRTAYHYSVKLTGGLSGVVRGFLHCL